MKYKAILFDFDYTLGDSTQAIVASYNAGLTQMGWPVPHREAVRRTVGHTLQDGYTMLTGDTEESRREEFLHRFKEHAGPIMVEQTVLFPGADQVICWLRQQGISTGIVSTKGGDQLESIFRKHGLREHLELIIGGQDVTKNKPDPEGLNKAIERLNVEKGELLYCGDTVIDAQTAQNAGVDFCAVLNGTTTAKELEAYPHVYIAPDLPHLLRWLKDK